MNSRFRYIFFCIIKYLLAFSAKVETLLFAYEMFSDYKPSNSFDEYFINNLNSRPEIFSPLLMSLDRMGLEELNRNHDAAKKLLLRHGATFRLNDSGEKGTERILPFDPLPRIVSKKDWIVLEKGLIQRLEAIDLFLNDIYGPQLILKDGIIPRSLIESSDGWRPQMLNTNLPLGRWCPVSGLDLIRDQNGEWLVLEDNLRCPSGVAYFLENRLVMKRIFPNLFSGKIVKPIDEYPSYLLRTLRELATWTDTPKIVLLTPGIFNSAYFEHSYLAQEMGIQLVQGHDLICNDNYVYLKTTSGLERVDVIYRRIDDDFLDPKNFRPDSMLGVSGLLEAAKINRVAIANAPGTGIADDKMIYSFVPKIIKYYLSEEPNINNVKTYLCHSDKERDFVLRNLSKLVVKSVSEAGGYGMLIGPHSTTNEINDFALKIRNNPRNFIAQPTLELSTVPSLCDGEIYPCHVDLRPYILRGKNTWVSPGGLTRVALKKGSLVVNSSQGGGCKDTWVVGD